MSAVPRVYAAQARDRSLQADWPATLDDAPPSDPELAVDLGEGRLLPALVTARRA